MSWLDKVSRDFVLEKALRIPLCIHECLKDEGCVGKFFHTTKDKRISVFVWKRVKIFFFVGVVFWTLVPLFHILYP